MAITVESDEGKDPQATQAATDPLKPDAHNPLNAPRVERPYSKGEGDFKGSVPEPEGFGQSTRAGGGDDHSETFSENGTGATKPADEPSFGNEGGGEAKMPPEAKAKSSADLAFLILDFYCDKMPQIFRWWASPNEKKLNELAVKGEVDFNLQLNFADGKTYTIASYFQEVRNKIEQGYAVDDKWKEEFKPYLIRWLKEKDWGVTTEQVMLFMLLEDLGTKTMSVLSTKNDIHNFTEWAKQATVTNRKQQQQPAAQAAAAPEWNTENRTAPEEARPFEPEPSPPPVHREVKEEDLPITPTEEVLPQDHPFA